MTPSLVSESYAGETVTPVAFLLVDQSRSRSATAIAVGMTLCTIGMYMSSGIVRENTASKPKFQTMVAHPTTFKPRGPFISPQPRAARPRNANTT